MKTRWNAAAQLMIDAPALSAVGQGVGSGVGDRSHQVPAGAGRGVGRGCERLCFWRGVGAWAVTKRHGAFEMHPERIAATPRGATWVFRGRPNARSGMKIDGR